MKKNHEKRTYILTSIICLLPILAGAVLYSRLPDTVVTHWDANGVPNGWQSKFVGVIVFPGILFLLNMLYPVILKLDPKKKNMDSKLVGLGQWIIPVISVFCSATTLLAALGREVHVETIAPVMVGVIMIAIGNYLPKTKQSYTMGIKLPWTLDSEENWNKTHRVGGFVFVIGGMCMAISGILGLGAVMFTAILILMCMVPTVYSYLLYKKGI